MTFCELNEAVVSDYIRLWDKMNYPHIDVFSDTIDSILKDERVAINSSCRDDLTEFSRGLQEKTVEAMTMIDSFTKRRAGNVDASHLNLGDNQQCNQVLFRGTRAQFHLIHLHHPLPSVNETLNAQHSSNLTTRSMKVLRLWMLNHFVPQLFAICLPGSCSKSDVKAILHSSVLEKQLHPISLSLEEAYHNDSFAYAAVKLLCKLLLIIIVLLNALGTYFNDSQCLREFNLRENCNLLFRESNDPKSKLISYSKVIYMLTASAEHIPVSVYPEVLRFLCHPMKRNLIVSHFTRYSLRVNTVFIGWNFTVSSFLSAFKWLPIFASRSVSLSQFVLARTLRTLPLMMVIICIMILIPESPLVNSEMMNILFGTLSSKCYENGWREVLFISNFISFDRMCLPIQWFVASDMQLYVISYFVILLISRTDRIYSCLIAPILFASVIEARFIREHHEKIINFGKAADWFIADPTQYVNMHMSTEAHGLPYVAGIWLGYMMAKDNRWSKIFSLSSLVASAVAVPVSLIFAYFIQIDEKFLSLTFVAQSMTFSVSLVILYFSLWSLRDYMFSPTLWVPSHLATVFSRIQYPFFLVHPVVISSLATSFEHTFSSITMMWACLLPTQLILSIVISVILNLTVELPFARLMDTKSRPKDTAKKQ